VKDFLAEEMNRRRESVGEKFSLPHLPNKVVEVEILKRQLITTFTTKNYGGRNSENSAYHQIYHAKWLKS